MKCCLCKRSLKEEQKIKDGNWRKGEYIEYLKVSFTDRKKTWEKVVCYECVDTIGDLFMMSSCQIKLKMPLIVGDIISYPVVEDVTSYQTCCGAVPSSLVKKHEVSQSWVSETANNTIQELENKLKKMRRFAIVWALDPGRKRIAFLKDLIKLRRQKNVKKRK